MRGILAIMFGLWIGLMPALAPVAAVAQDGAFPRQLVVVELFTSQGCSSCPPADALLAELAMRDDVLPLALHVDYWDYIGWADTFARPEHTGRQKAYARVAHARSIYTPQMVIGGVDHVIGHKPMKVADFLQEHRARMGGVEIETALSDGQMSVVARARHGTDLPNELLVDIIAFAPQASVEITRGENAGRQLGYTNIVEDWGNLGHWDGVGEWRGTFDVPSQGALAVIVQVPGPGEILSATRVR